MVPQALFDAVEQKLAQVSGDNSKLATTADRWELAKKIVWRRVHLFIVVRVGVYTSAK